MKIEIKTTELTRSFVDQMKSAVMLELVNGKLLGYACNILPRERRRYKHIYV